MAGSRGTVRRMAESLIVVAVTCAMHAAAEQGLEDDLDSQIADRQPSRVSRPPLEHFASLPKVADVSLSPSGAYVALSVNVDGRSGVVVHTVSDGLVRPLLSNDHELAVISWIRWANDTQLLVSVRFPAERYNTETMETRLLLANAVTAEVRPVLKRPRRGDYIPQMQDRVVDLLPDDPGHVLMALDPKRPMEIGVYRVALDNGRHKQVRGPRDGFVGWLTDQQHRVRVGTRLDDDKLEIHYLDLHQDHWRQAWTFDLLSEAVISPLGFGLDPDILYVHAYQDGHLAVFKVDLRDPTLELVPVLAIDGRDVEGSLVHSPRTGEAIGLELADGTLALWDKTYQPLVRGLEKAFDDRRTALLDMSRDESRYLFYTESDRDPGTYYFGDRQAGTLSPIADRYPDLDPEHLSGKRTIRYTSRDGLTIEGFLTLPAGVEHRRLPAVILPHGGPMSRDSRGFDYWTEFLASRGYAVLQMNFRGSTGYGIDFLKAGLQNWGLEMQNDVEDGTRWLIDEGVADPARICIVGASYGGYAALMGAAMSPALFRCAVSFAGVTDLRELVRHSRRFVGAELVEKVVGDNFRSLRERSPVTLADRIKIPVLLVHGDKDVTVPSIHAVRMRRALERTGADLTYIEQAGGDHHLSRQSHRLELFQAMERFLGSHLAAPAAQPPSGAPATAGRTPL